MPKKTKKFIDRKNAITFHLVHRSQQDPLIADEKAPQRVLVPVQNKNELDRGKQIEQQHKYGIYFDDDYNYLQHLRDIDEKAEWSEGVRILKDESKLQLPSSVFASRVEEDVGLLNKAAPHSGPRPDLDPDIIAAMDNDFDYDNPDNILEDNFMELADTPGSREESEFEEDSEVSSDFEFEKEDEASSLNEAPSSFKNEETKSRFTEYSMSCSVLERNEHLTLLDKRFEKMFADYDDDKIGGLECEEIKGHIPANSELLLQYAEEFRKEKEKQFLDKNEIIVKYGMIESSEDEDLITVEVKNKPKYDVESILSTRSNKHNRPTIIPAPPPKKKKIKINKQTGMPENVLGANKLTTKNVSQFDEQSSSLERKANTKSVGASSVMSALSMLSIRPKDETPKEKKQRKERLKEYRRERRKEKKANVLAFKDEAKRQAKISINNRQNVNGIKIL